MARGNSIVVVANPRGLFREGTLKTGQTVKPGTVVQVDPSVAMVGGRFTYEIFNRAADGATPKGAIWVVIEDSLQGHTVTDAYAAGDRLFLYSPAAGEELNMLLLDVSGTADDHSVGEQLIIDEDTGKLIATTGSPAVTPFTLMEAVTDPVADTLVWVEYTGY
jgi:hypothetical protein